MGWWVQISLCLVECLQDMMRVKVKLLNKMVLNLLNFMDQVLIQLLINIMEALPIIEVVKVKRFN